jgi:Ca2+-binding EF-hand superfamily protein
MNPRNTDESIDASIADYGHASTQPRKSQLFEVAVARKLKNRSANLMDTFLKLDMDGDGFVSRSDLRTSLHNMYGINLTESQLDAIFTRFAFFDHTCTTEGEISGSRGMRYADFVNYIHDTALDLETSSDEYGSSLDLVVANPNNEQEMPPTLNATTTTHRVILIASTTTTTHDAVHGSNDSSYRSSIEEEDYNHISDEDLILALSRKCSTTTAEGGLAKAFDRFDVSNTGNLGPREICAALSEMGIAISEQRAASLISNFHRIGNGKLLNKADFVTMISTTVTKHNQASTNILSSSTTSRARPSSSSSDHVFSPWDTQTQTFTDASRTDTDIESIILKFRTAAKEHFRNATQMFHKLDKEDKRSITHDQLKEAFEELGVHITPMQAKRIVSKFDTEGSGRLKFYQFLNLISGGSA